MILLPSRGRPQLLQRFFQVGKPSLKGIVILDEDDFHHYKKVTIPDFWDVIVLPRNCISYKCNKVFEMFPNEEFYGITNDDVVPETEEWDLKLLYHAGKENFAYGDDGINHRWSTSVMGGDLVRQLGWVLCPAVRHFYTDDAWEILKEIGLGIFLPDIKVTHYHFSNGKAPVDKTYMERGIPEEDRVRYEDWKRDEWPSLKQKLLSWKYKCQSQAIAS